MLPLAVQLQNSTLRGLNRAPEPAFTRVRVDLLRHDDARLLPYTLGSGRVQRVAQCTLEPLPVSQPIQCLRSPRLAALLVLRRAERQRLRCCQHLAHPPGLRTCASSTMSITIESMIDAPRTPAPYQPAPS